MRDFDRCYDEYAQPLLRFLVYRTGERALSEDIVADTFERVLKSRLRFDPRKSSEKTWIYSIALNLLRDHVRHWAVAERALGRSPTPVAATSAADALDPVEDRDLVGTGLAPCRPRSARRSRCDMAPT